MKPQLAAVIFILVALVGMVACYYAGKSQGRIDAAESDLAKARKRMLEAEDNIFRATAGVRINKKMRGPDHAR